MMPIEIEPYKKPKFVESEEDIVDGYEFDKMYNFFPEFLEEVYEGDNVDELSSANDKLLYYLNHRNKYQYIATLKIIKKRESIYCEYYYDNSGDIICFLIVDPSNKRYYTRLTAVAIFKKQIEEVF